MTTEHQASRTLVKSPPELWAECSDPGSLARHIGEFGEIRITRLDPETSIAWEAERAVGTVEIEPSGWGTKVTLTAQTSADEDGHEEVDTETVPDEPAPVALAKEPMAIPEGATETAPDPPPAPADPVEEESDAKVEETVAQSDPAVAADPRPAGRRWKRLIARTRRWLGSAGKPPDGPDPASAGPEEVSGPEPVTPESEFAVFTPETIDGTGPPDAPAPSDGPVPPDEPAPSDTPAPADAHVPSADAPPADQVDRAPSLDPNAVLIAALDSLGQAHHRPFSRA